MVVRIRLARFGRRHAPFYNIVVTQARTARNSKPIEVLGTYDPIPKPPIDGEGRPWKDIKLDSTRAKYWLGVGAQPSDTAWRLLSMAGLLEPKFRPIDALPKVPQPERKKWWDLKKEKADQKAQLKTADSAKTEKVKTSV